MILYILLGVHCFQFSKFSLPYSLFNNVDYKALADERAELDPSNPDDYQRISDIDQERLDGLSFTKLNSKGIGILIVDKLVVKSGFEFRSWSIQSR